MILHLIFHNVYEIIFPMNGQPLPQHYWLKSYSCCKIWPLFILKSVDVSRKVTPSNFLQFLVDWITTVKSKRFMVHRKCFSRKSEGMESAPTPGLRSPQNIPCLEVKPYQEYSFSYTILQHYGILTFNIKLFTPSIKSSG